MSERLGWVAVTIMLFAMGLTLYLLGVRNGRAEQKKLDAEWYAKNPVVIEREVPTKIRFDGAGIESECYAVDAGHLRCNFTKGVGFVGAPKPEKRSKRPGHKTEVQPKEYVRPESCNKPETWTAKDCLIISGGDPDYLKDVSAKEIIQQQGCDPPLPADSYLGCVKWEPIHLGWTCEDKRRILQVSEDGKFHCILPPSVPAEPK